MEKKEKVFIISATLLILIGVFIAFITSNSQKVPPEAIVQNSEKKSITAVMGGYEWKVFGNVEKTDAIDLKNNEYSLNNTIVSKTGEELTISTEEKFIVEQVEYISNVSNESFDVSSRYDETGNYFTISSPEIEGTYICLFKLNFYDKGSAEYGMKLVVTDDNIYDVENIVNYKNTSLTDVSKLKELLQKLPYAKQLDGIMIDKVSSSPSLIVKYSNDSITKEDLMNNTIALFALIPDLELVIYETNDEIEEAKIYYSREEINNLVSRDVLEYANDMELWTKEIIYKESSLDNDIVTIYVSTITTMLAKVSEKDIGDFVAIDIIERNASGDVNTSGDFILNEYETQNLLRELNKEYKTVLNVDFNEFNNTSGTLIKVNITDNTENLYDVNVNLTTSTGEILEETYKAIEENDTIMIKGEDEVEEEVIEVNEEEVINTESGE